MAKTDNAQELNSLPQDSTTSTQTYSIAQLAKHFLRSDGWVCLRKDTLRELYPEELHLMFDRAGSLTQLGFERFEELFKFTANVEIKTVRNRRKAVKKTPLMSFDEYEDYVRSKQGKPPLHKGSQTVGDVINNVLNRTSVESTVAEPIEAELVEDTNIRTVEFAYLEPPAEEYNALAEMEEQTTLMLSEANTVFQHNLAQLLEVARAEAQVVAQSLKQVYVEEFAAAKIEALSEAVTSAPKAQAPKSVQVKRRSVSS